MIDLRSDTVTRPTKAMYEAMAAAELGDDVFGDDPAANELEAYAAEMCGKEAAMFTPTATMANLIAACVHCHERESEIIIGHKSHMYCYEQGGLSQVAGALPRVIQNESDGTMPIGAVLGAIRKPLPLQDSEAFRIHACFGVTRMVCIENTHNGCEGAVLPLEYIDSLGQALEDHDIPLHMDGARVFNAVAEMKGVSLPRLLKHVSSISICLSKGLSAPVGCILAGSSDFINRARRVRKCLGGGMRQVGVLAGPALVALQQMPPQIAQDNRRARDLYLGVCALIGSEATRVPQSNLVYFHGVPDASAIVQELHDKGIRCIALGPTSFRLATHRHITDDNIRQAVPIVTAVLKSHHVVQV